MRKFFVSVAEGTLVLALSSCSGGGTATSVPVVLPSQHLSLAAGLGDAAPAASSGRAERVCGDVPVGFARCHAWLRTDLPPNTSPFTTSGVAGYHPADLQAAYKLPSTTRGYGQTVAIVAAYDDPYAQSDLDVYRSYFALPACTATNGCFRKVNEFGQQGSYPSPSASWSQEISLDLDMVSATCPNCHILLVEAKSASVTDLGTAVDTAAKLGATEISNSYGGSEFSGETYDASYYNHPGIMVTASAGDGGFGTVFPAASRYVTAVGGTTLVRASNTRGWYETAWSGTGSGCGLYISKPPWQTDTGCRNRTIGDVAADANPYTGVAVYDSFSFDGYKGWLVFGGTSVSSPVIASVYALAGNASSLTYGSYPYAHRSALFDVTSGSNGTCSVKYLCNAVTGYDGPTGNGTPDGIGAF